MNADHKSNLEDQIVNTSVLKDEEHTSPLLKEKRKKKKKDKNMDTFANIVSPKKIKKCDETFNKQHDGESKTYQLNTHKHYKKDVNTNIQSNSTLNICDENKEHTSLLQETKKKKKKKKEKEKTVDQDNLYVDTVTSKKHKKKRPNSCNEPCDHFDTNLNMTCSINNDVTTSNDLNPPEDYEYTSLLEKSKKKKKKKKKKENIEDNLFVDKVASKKHKNEQQISCHKPFDHIDTNLVMNCSENNDVTSSNNLKTLEDDQYTSLLEESKKKKKKKKKKENIEDNLYVGTVASKKHKKDEQISSHKPYDHFNTNLSMSSRENNDVNTSYNLNTPEDDECISLLHEMKKKKKKKKKKKEDIEDILYNDTVALKKDKKKTKNFM